MYIFLHSHLVEQKFRSALTKHTVLFIHESLQEIAHCRNRVLYLCLDIPVFWIDDVYLTGLVPAL
jgi:hypothetical protein